MDYTYENLMAIIDEPATEGKNMDAYDAFNKALQSGKNNISQANKNVKDGKYDAAIANLQQAKKIFRMVLLKLIMFQLVFYQIPSFSGLLNPRYQCIKCFEKQKLSINIA